MTTHRLTFHGSRRTKCRLQVPDIITLHAGVTTWDDGDDAGDWCPECYPEAVIQAVAENVTRGVLRKFTVMTERRDPSGKVEAIRAGFAMENRDQSVSVTLDVLPIDGRLRLVPQ